MNSEILKMCENTVDEISSEISKIINCDQNDQNAIGVLNGLP